MVDFASDSILVLLDVTPAGELAKSSAGLLGAAAGVGTPVALIVAGESAHADLVAAAGELGAAVVLTAGLGGADTALTVPLVDALAAASALVRPDAVLVSNSIEGRDVAGRFAVRSRSALCVDAVGVSRDDEGVLAPILRRRQQQVGRSLVGQGICRTRCGPGERAAGDLPAPSADQEFRTGAD